LFIDPLALIALAVGVGVVAFCLGTLMRARDRLPPRPIDAKLRIIPTETPKKPEKPAASRAALSDDRQLQAVVDWLLTQAFEQTGVRVADEPLAYQRIVEAAQKAVRELKTQEAVSISLPYLTADATGPKHFETRLTRDVIAELSRY
jgi:hypothetical protein